MTKYDIDKALHDVRIENKSDLPSEKLISKNALFAMILAIFVVGWFAGSDESEFSCYFFVKILKMRLSVAQLSSFA